MSAWSSLVIAGLLEIVWAVGLKYTDGFTRLVPSLVTLVSLSGSMWLLSVAAREIPLGTAYAVWVGIGSTGTALLGAWLFREPVTPLRAACLLMLVVAIIGLKFSAPVSPP